MNRRGFFAALAGLPFIDRFVPHLKAKPAQPESTYTYRVEFVKTGVAGRPDITPPADVKGQTLYSSSDGITWTRIGECRTDKGWKTVRREPGSIRGRSRFQ